MSIMPKKAFPEYVVSNIRPVDFITAVKYSSISGLNCS